MRYAANTAVSTARSRAEIEETLARYGADGFRYGWADREGKRIEQIDFSAKGKLLRFTMIMPSQADKQFRFTPARHNRRSDKETMEAWEQACRQRWRALCLAIKAKLEAVDVGITTFESEFLAHIVDPGTGRTMADQIIPQLERVYSGIEGTVRLPGLPDYSEFENQSTETPA